MSSDRSLRLQVILDAVDRATAPLKRVLESSNGLSKAVKGARDRLRELEQQQKKLESFRTTTRDFHATAGALANAQAKVKELATAMKATEAPTKAQTRAFEAARREAARLKDAHATLAERQQRTRLELERAGMPTAKLATHQRELKGRIDAANQALAQQTARLKTHGEQMARARAAHERYDQAMSRRNALAGAGASGAAAGVAMGLPILNMVKNYATFEDAMLGVARQVEGARDANGRYTQTYYDMADAIVAMSRRIPMATTEIAALVEAGARMGIQGKADLLAFADTAAMAATAFDAAAGEIGENIARIANLYKIPIASISQLGDTINWLDDNAQSKGADIIEVMQRIAGISQTVGMSFKDAAALGSTFLSLGASAEVAATGANALIRELAIAGNQPAKFQAALHSIGLSPDAVQTGMIKDSTGTILRVLEAIKALPREQQLGAAVGLFGKEYGDDVAKIAENMGEYRRQLALVNDEQARGSMAREADARNTTLSARWQMTLNRLFADSAQGGSVLKSVLFSLLDTVDTMLDGLHRWMQANPGLTQGIVTGAAAIAALVTGVSALALGIAAVLGPLALVKLGLALVAPVVVAVVGAAGPMLAVLTAIGIAAFTIYNNWDRIKSAFVDVFRFIADGIERFFVSKITWVLDKVRAAQELAAKFGIGSGASSAAAAPLMAGGGGSVTYATSAPITLVQQPGQSPQDMAAEVQRQLEQRERATAARGRSRLTDME
ncbi:phage tail tape measure protein [Methyloversatilis sp.]|uniref:phage tail tape measure protein n=1 Tax=Methyloversatilis sp. TaxID=2569862 RepID=UPI002735F03C|nr:phage tail tape measure protein [Methyloversatilis sp.]MDP3579128.1 phage tail tape measure protein [Methyloversatilis sp.]